MPSIALVGAGFAGLNAAHILTHHGANLSIFDKGTFPGGRLSTRRSFDHDFTFDHGTQYFSAKDPRFAQRVTQWLEADIIAPWQARLVQFDAEGNHSPVQPDPPRYVGTPHMNRLAEHLASDLPLKLKTRITGIVHRDPGYELYTRDHSHGVFDAVLLNLPPVQACELLEDIDTPTLAHLAASHHMEPCWCAMLAHDEPLADFDAASVKHPNSPLAWIARDSSKPERLASPPYTWVLHASKEWSHAHLEADRDDVARALMHAFFDLLPSPPDTPPIHLKAHRWRYALAHCKAPGTHIEIDQPIALCGDWLEGNRLEDAFISGHKAAHQLIERLGLKPCRTLDGHDVWMLPS